MQRLRPHALGLVLVPLLIGTSGCKEDPPPPPPPSATAGPVGGPTLKDAEAKAQFTPRKSQVPRVDKDTMKRYRVEACFFGAQGLRLLADGYLTSTGGKMPTAEKLPSFGDYPNAQEPPEGQKNKLQRRAVSVASSVPFIRYLRYCAIAKSLKDPSVEKLDEAIVAFDKYSTPLSQYLIQATRYFGTKQFEKDEFKRGKFLHEKLNEALPKVDEQLATLVEPVNAYAATAGESPEKLDEPGTAAREAIKKARALAITFLPNGEAEGRQALLDEVVAAQKALTEAAEKDSKSPYGKAVSPKLEAFITAAKAAIEAKEPSKQQTYSVMFAMADLIEVNQRSLNQLLRNRGDVQPGGKPMRLLNPNIRQRMPATPSPAATQ